MQTQADQPDGLLSRSLQTIRCTEPMLAEVQDMIEVLNRNCAQLRNHLEKTQEFSQQILRQLDGSLGHASGRNAAPHDTARDCIQDICRELADKCFSMGSALRPLGASEERLLRAQSTIAEVNRNMNRLQQHLMATQDIMDQKAEETKKGLDKACEGNLTLQRAMEVLKDRNEKEKANYRSEREAYEREKRRVEEEIRNLSSRVQELEQENCVQRTLLEEQEKKTKELLAQRQEQEARLTEIQRNISNLREEKEEKQRRIENLEGQLLEKGATCGCLLQNVGSIQAQLTKQRSANEELNAERIQLIQQRETLKAREDNCQKRKNALQTRLMFWRATAHAFYRKLVARRKERRLMKRNQVQTNKRNTTLQRALNELTIKAQRERTANETSTQQAQGQIGVMQTDVSRLRETVQILEDQLQQAQNNVRSRDEEIASLRGEMAQASLQVTGLTNTTQALSEQLSTMATDKEGLERKVMELVQENGDLRLGWTQAITANQALKQQADTEADRFRQLTGLFQQVQRQPAALQAELEKFRQDVHSFQGQLEEARSLLRSRDEEIASLRGDVDSLKASLTESQAREHDLETVLRASRTHVWRYQAEVDEQRKKTKEFLAHGQKQEARLTEIERNISNLREEKEEKQRRIEKLEGQLLEKEATCGCLLQNVASVQAQLTKQRSANEELNAKLMQLIQQRETLKAHEDNYQKRKNTLQTRLMFWRATAHIFYRKLGAFQQVWRQPAAGQAELERFRQDVHRLQGQLQEARSLVRSRDQKIASLRASTQQGQIEAMQTGVIRLRETVQILEVQLEQERNNVRSRDEKIASLRGEMAKVSLQVTGLTNTTQALSEELSTMATDKEVLQRKVKELGQENGDLRLGWTQAITANQALKQQADTEADRFRQLTGAFQQVRRQPAAGQAELERFRQDVHRLQGQLEEARRLVRARDEEIASLRGLAISLAMLTVFFFIQSLYVLK